MSFIYCLILIAIAWALSTFIDSLSNVGALLGSLPMWLGLAAIAGIISWLVGEP
jgi:divalent metal cation (Fe/Co/Zn/Cd) transporter